MDRSDWGVKRICLKCNARFYDFNKSPIECPVCGTIFDPESSLKKKSKNSVRKSDLDEEKIEDIVDDDLIDEDADDDMDDDVDEEMNLGN